VLAGRITDEFGEPAPGVRVEALEPRFIRGRRVVVPARLATTNDIGEYRLGGLEPGSYQLRATARDVWESDDGKETFVFAVTYFPGVTASREARNITLGVGEEVAALDFPLSFGRAARVTGVVQDARGEPMAGQVVHYSHISRTIGGRLLSSGPGGTTKTDAAGAFEFTRIAPGEYMVYSSGPEERFRASMVLNDGDVRHVVLSPRRPTAAIGSVVTDDGEKPPFPAARLRVVPVDVDPEIVLRGWGEPSDTTVTSDWTFRLLDLHGEYLLRIDGLPGEWRVKSVRHGARDVTDTPLRIERGTADVEGLRIVLSRSGALVTGEVVDRQGAPAPDATVVLFAANSAQWGIGSRFVRAVRPGSDGRFSIPGVAPGAYRIVARDFVIEGQWEEAAFLQALLRDASAIELKEGSSESIRLTLAEAR
jgi:protocatechuate 3,4-dioxygenase beta subunit